MPRGGTAGGSKKSSSITFNKPCKSEFQVTDWSFIKEGLGNISYFSQQISWLFSAEPSFIRKIKEQVGYKEAVSIDAKVTKSGFDS